MPPRLASVVVERLAQAVAIERMSQDGKDETAHAFHQYLSGVAKNMSDLSSHLRMRTVTMKVAVGACGSNGACSDLAKEGVKIPHLNAISRKRKPGAAAHMKVLKYQKQADVLFIPKVQFSRELRDCLGEYSVNTRVSEDALVYSQYVAEQFIRKVLADALMLCQYAKRATVIASDVRKAYELEMSRVNSNWIANVGLGHYEYSTYIRRVLKQVHQEMKISKNVLSQLNQLVNCIAILLVQKANWFRQQVGNKTLSSRDVQTAVRWCLSQELSKHAVSEGTKALTKFFSNAAPNAGARPPRPVVPANDDDIVLAGPGVAAAAGPGPAVAAIPVAPAVEPRGGPRLAKWRLRVSHSKRAGLQFPIALGKHLMHECSERVSAGAPVYLAGVLEYLCAEFMELAGNWTRNDRKAIMCSRHLKQAIAGDHELVELCYRLNYSVIG